MKANSYLQLGLVLACTLTTSSATDYFVSLDGGNVPPFASWADAATNIQAAIDSASDGDTVWVTNGVYSTGGKVMSGDLTNRIALDKALTVKSVNGPFVTTIQGDGAFTGTAAVRCAWLTNGAALRGFTLKAGGTRQSGDVISLQSGGGVWCSSSNATVANCLVISNASVANGSGVYRGTILNCLVRGNAKLGAYGANLINCTITSNSFGGVTLCGLTNSILAYNNLESIGGCTLTYCSTLSTVPGVGNVVGNPRLLPDGIHLANDSPCRDSGTNFTAGVDIDGETWADPPSIGCDQWQLSPLIVVQPKVQMTNSLPGFNIGVTVNGQDPFTCWWFRDGTLLEDNGHYSGAHTTNLLAIGVFDYDAGNYQVIVSNAFGVVTSAVTQLAFRYVNIANPTPAPPFTSWASAATNIQEAIDAAAAGEVVMVTNGIYATGGKVKAGDLTNRIALDKAILLQSINGPEATIIQGAWDPATTNGPLAVRCAWLTNGATLKGFTLRGGATRNSGGSFILQSGGGVWCSSNSATVINCLIVENCAQQQGGGAYDGTLSDCIISNNAVLYNGRGGGAASCILKNSRIYANYAMYGGGTADAMLSNCAVLRNYGSSGGGGCDQSRLDNCTVSLNFCRILGTGGGGVRWIGTVTFFARNCIIWNNNGGNDNYQISGGKLTNCCTYPLPSGTGSISVDPQLLGDGFHLGAASPCIDAGNPAFVTGTDIDGQDWASPPSIGCDQWQPEPLLAVQPIPKAAVGDGQSVMQVEVAGDPATVCAWIKDGLPVTEDAHYTNAQSAKLLIRDFGVGDAGVYQVVASNSFGVVTSQVVQVTVHCVDQASALPAGPFTSWGSAATAIQDAVDVAGPADVVLVTNGVYASGGRTNSGALTNRIVISKPLLVTSVNGPDRTIIEGQWDPTSTNGSSAVRCAWLGDGAALSGFTLRNGATAQNVSGSDGGGGGALCSSTNAELVNCVITNSTAWVSGGGVRNGLLRNSKLVGNSVVSDFGFPWGGGGADDCTLVNCILTRNTSWRRGGGASDSWLFNCVLTENSSGGLGGGVNGNALVNCTVAANVATTGGGVSGAYLTNCIVYLNSAPTSPNVAYPLVSEFTCSTPSLAGTGNISDDPQFTDGWHLAATSPCRGMGAASAATGTDLDGDPWANPPSMGCDEVYDAALVGPLSVSLTAAYPEVAAYGSLPLFGEVTGRAASVAWSFGEGTTFTNLSALTFHTWTNPGDYLVTFTAYNTDNPAGVSTSQMVHVVELVAPQLTASGLSSNNFTLAFPGQAGITYVVEQATNLAPPVTWQTVQTLISTGSVVQVTDTKATNAMRFYRTRMQ